MSQYSLSKSTQKPVHGLIIGAISLSFCFAAPSQSAAQEAAATPANTIAGVAFRDKNSDGKRDSTDPGVAGIVVVAYGADGGTRGTATTDGNGIYTLTTTGSGPYRVEFTKQPSFLRPGPQGADSGTTTQFLPDGNASNINVNFVNPSDFVGVNTKLATSIFVMGDQNSTKSSLVEHPYAVNSLTGSEQVPLALANQIGTTYGMAYKRSSKDLFAAAFVRRGTGFGPGGIGAIYKVPISGTPSVLVNIGNAAGSFSKPRDFNPDPPDFDTEAMTLTGKSGFGDMEISEDERSLFAINLANRSLYKIDIAAAEAAPGGTAGVTLLSQTPDPGCITGVARPFALKIKDDVFYMGGVCTGELGPTLGNTETLKAYVFTYTLAAGWGAKPVLEFGLDYPITCADVYSGYIPNHSCGRPGAVGSVADWWSWYDQTPVRVEFFDTAYSFNSETEDGFVISPQPILSGIELDGNDMIIGMRDRFADQIGWDDPGPGGIGTSPFGARNMYSVPAGDILRASPAITNPLAGAPESPNVVVKWQLEGNASGATFGPGSKPNSGAGPCSSAQGPNGENCGEFYDDNFNPTTATGHDEVSMGAVTQLEGAGEVVSTAYDPFDFQSAGTMQLSRVNGSRVRGFEIFRGGAFITNDGRLNKSNGMGDIEVMTDPAPIEIGNRIWRDVNKNGVQDPDEAGIANTTVNLYRLGFGADCVAGNADDALAIAQALTGGNGEYYFRTGAGADAQLDSVGLVNGTVCGLKTDGRYNIKLDKPADFQTGGALNNCTLTVQDNALSAAGGSDMNDSDAALVGGFPTISYTLGSPGNNDHTLDIGCYVNNVVAPVVSLGNLVWLDNNNNSMVDAGEAGVGNVAVNLYCDSDNSNALSAADAFISSTKTISTGLYLFGNLTPTGGSCSGYIVSVTAPNFCTGGPLAGYANSKLSVAGNSDVNNKDHGVDASASCSQAISSTPVSVTVGSEPVNDDDQDASSNLSMDFGFYKLAALGNRVWVDQNKNGLQDAGELPIAGITVTLKNTAGAVLSTTYTGGNGLYAFTNLTPETYSVCFELPKGYAFTQQGTNATSDTDSNADMTTGCTKPIALSMGENNITLDVGVVPTVPTAVQVLSFAAMRQANGIRIRWSTASELNTFGYVVYGSNQNNRTQAGLVTPQMVMAKGSGDYEFVDTNASATEQYFYWLGEVETDSTMVIAAQTMVEAALPPPVMQVLPQENVAIVETGNVSVLPVSVPASAPAVQTQSSVPVVAQVVVQKSNQVLPASLPSTQKFASGSVSLQAGLAVASAPKQAQPKLAERVQHVAPHNHSAQNVRESDVVVAIQKVSAQVDVVVAPKPNVAAIGMTQHSNVLLAMAILGVVCFVAAGSVVVAIAKNKKQP